MKKGLILALMLVSTPLIAEQASMVCSMGSQYFDCPTGAEHSDIIRDIGNAEELHQYRMNSDEAYHQQMNVFQSLTSTERMVETMVDTNAYTVFDIMAAIMRKDEITAEAALTFIEPFFTLYE